MKTASYRALLALALAACGCGGGGGPTLGVTPTSLSLRAGDGPAGVTATLTGAPGPVTWSLSPGLGTLSATTGASVLYTPPAALSSSISEVLTAAAAGKAARVIIAVAPRTAATPSLAVFPSSASAAAGGGPITFGTALANASGTVTWTLDNPAVGTLSASSGPSVAWTPPPSVVQAQSVTLTASAAGVSSAAKIVVVPSGPASLPNWTYHPASGWTSDTLALPVPAGESAMVLLLNTDPNAVDGAGASLTVTGTSAVASVLATASSALSAGAGASGTTTSIDPALRGGEAALAPRVSAAKRTGALGRLPQALTAAAPADPGSFCVAYGAPGPLASFTRISAPLAWTSAHALFYVDAADATQFQTTDWQNLATLWESQIYPSDTGIFGPPSDVDGNGKLIVLFTDKLGASSNGGVMAGYFWAGDLFGPDTSPGCNCGTAGAPACTATGSLAFPFRGSNGADMFVMNTPNNLTTANYKLADALTQVIPSTLAHEFQHLINFNLHCLLPPNDCVVEETWLNEAMSKVAEDEAGFGWHTSVTAAKEYLMLAPSSGTYTYTSYDTASMTAWPAAGGDPVGNYEGVHSFLRYHTDQHGTALLTALSGDPSTGNLLAGKANLAWALGATFESAMADFATAVAFSNETFVPDPRFDYTGAAWTPFHTALRYLQYVDLNPGTTATASVRQDGWSAFATGAAGTGGATIVVQSSAAVKPAVLLVTFTGTLPAN